MSSIKAAGFNLSCGCWFASVCVGVFGGVGEGGTAASAQRELVLAGSAQGLCVISVFAGVVACSASSCFISVIAVAKMSSSKVAGFLFVRVVGVVVVGVLLFAVLAFVVGVVHVGDSWFAVRVQVVGVVVVGELGFAALCFGRRGVGVVVVVMVVHVVVVVTAHSSISRLVAGFTAVCSLDCFP